MGSEMCIRDRLYADGAQVSGLDHHTSAEKHVALFTRVQRRDAHVFTQLRERESDSARRKALHGGLAHQTRGSTPDSGQRSSQVERAWTGGGGIGAAKRTRGFSERFSGVNIGGESARRARVGRRRRKFVG